MKYKLNNIYNEDCLQAMKQIPDKFFELAIVDPPYGIDFAKQHTGKGWVVRETKNWDKEIPNEDYFKELFRVSKNQIIWGGNYFSKHLQSSMGWIFWDKGQRDFSLADGELAWTSFDRALRVFDFSRAKLNKKREGFHPTEKPIALYEWLLINYAKKGDKILDTHLGSASSIIACKKLGFEYLGFELDEDYFKSASERIAKFESQENLFDILNEKEVEKQEQENLFNVDIR